MRPPTRYMIGTIVIALLLQPTLVRPRAADVATPAGREWPLFGGDTANSRYSGLTQINTANVKTLKGAWVSSRFEDGATSRSVPVVVDGLMFVTAGGRVYALNAKTGDMVWSYLSETRQATGRYGIMGSGIALPSNKGVAVAEGLAFVGLADGRTIALQAKTGELVWSRHIGDENGRKGQAVAAAPTYANGVLYVGLANGDFGLRGRVVALEAKTGRELWRFFVIPGPGEEGHDTWPKENEVWKVGGAGIWLNGTVDGELGMVYFTTGNTVPQTGGEIRAGDNLYTSSIVALDSKTGALRWHFQAVRHDIWDADIPIAPVLFDVEIDGRLRKGVAVMRGDGYLFLLDRLSGKGILPIEERPVPQYARMKTAATQPFPVGGQSLVPDCNEWRDRIPAGWLLSCDPFTPPKFETPNVMAPNFGVRVHPMSYSPQTGYVYAQGSITLAGRWRVSSDPWFFGTGSVPVTAPPGRSVFGAIDTRTNKVVWRKETPPGLLGTTGVMTTAGGLLFRGSADGTAEAYDARTGDLLWQFQVAGTIGPFSTYEIDGEQFVAMAVGPSIWAFMLRGTLPPVETRPVGAAPGGGPGGAIERTNDIETATLRTSAVTGNRYTTDQYSFSPARARVNAGTRVRWFNNGLLTHTIMAQDGAWTTGTLEPAEEGVVVFDRPGTYTYLCKEHPWSIGQVVVEPTALPDTTARSGGDMAEGVAVASGGAAAQSGRGKVLFGRHCGSCHGEDLRGRDVAPALAGPEFLQRWQSRTVGELFARTRTTMPQLSPGSLTESAYLDVIAFLLQANDVALAPEPLTSTPESLERVIRK